MLEYTTTDYTEWLNKIKIPQQNQEHNNNTLSKVWPGYNGIGLTHYLFVKNTYGNNAFITIELHHTTNDIYKIQPKISWYDLIQKHFSYLSENEQLDLLYAEKISYSSSSAGTIIIAFNKQNEEMFEITI